ncbi:MAG: hypothetical protein JWM38_2557, partial [Sphingomonas bacterium]|nr:hypothetical protein [Sphingomonas bacterium]
QKRTGEIRHGVANYAPHSALNFAIDRIDPFASAYHLGTAK